MTLTQRQRFQLESALFFVASLGLVATAISAGWFRSADGGLYDTMIKAVDMAPAEGLLIVAIDDQSLDAYGPWPWPRARQAELLAAIAATKPRAVLLDVVFAGNSTTADDAKLVAAAATLDTLALPLILDATANRRQLIEVLPFPNMLAQAQVLGHVHVELDDDAIVRGTYLYQGIGDAHWPHVTLALAEHLEALDPGRYACAAEPPAVLSIQNHRCTFVYTPFVGPPGSFPEVSALDLLTGKVPATTLSNAIVFVGVVASGTTDLVTTPVSGASRPMSGIEYNANLYSALVQGLVKREAPLWSVYLLNLLCVALPAMVLPRRKAKGMLAAALLCALVPVAISALLLTLSNVWLPLASAALVCLFAYPYWSWRRHEVAWQFIEAEILRVEGERGRWDLSRAPDAAVQLGRLAELLDAQISSGNDHHGRGAGNEHSLPLSLADGESVTLERSNPFSHAEQQLAARTRAKLSADVEGPEAFPAEVLIAEIRRLRTGADEVRLGREIAHKGLEQMPNGVVVFSALGEVLFINSAGRTLLDCPAEPPNDYASLLEKVSTPLGQNWHDIVRNVVLDQRTISFEARAANDELVVVETASLAEADRSVESWVLTITDMTEIRMAEQDREEALAFLSHDLRSPMLSVLALVRGTDNHPPLDQIGSYAQRALQISDQFLQLSRVQAREHFERYDVNILAVTSNALEQMYALAQDQNIEFVVDPLVAEDEEGVWIFGNGELLERAFVNLLENAIKYSEPNSRIDITVSNQPDEIAISVTDQGFGIPSSELQHIFEPYFRSNAAELAQRRGAGLGLRFVKTVIERHDGSIRAESVVGKGSTFTVTLRKPAQDP